MKIAVYTILALIAFAFNSILCRLALRGDEIDAASFTAVRLVSGAVMLIVISYFFSKKSKQVKRGNWPSAFFLFAYAICFSFAYLSLTTGTGALILFGSVQVTMIATAIIRGERPSGFEWLGLLVATGGLVYLVFPSLASPSLVSSALMIAAGVSWGSYTLRGRGSGDPLADTQGNFTRTIPLAAIAILLFLPNLHLSDYGMLLAILSGGVASGIGYTVWYVALKHHSATRAAVLQLAVPIITASIGVLFLAEGWTLSLIIAAALILGGIGMSIFGKMGI